MNIRKYRAETSGWWDVPSHVWDNVIFHIGQWGEDEPSITYNYGLYNPRTHELIPKESYKKELVEEKKKERERLLKRTEELQKEIENLGA